MYLSAVLSYTARPRRLGSPPRSIDTSLSQEVGKFLRPLILLNSGFQMDSTSRKRSGYPMLMTCDLMCTGVSQVSEALITRMGTCRIVQPSQIQKKSTRNLKPQKITTIHHVSIVSHCCSLMESTGNLASSHPDPLPPDPPILHRDEPSSALLPTSSQAPLPLSRESVHPSPTVPPQACE